MTRPESDPKIRELLGAVDAEPPAGAVDRGWARFEGAARARTERAPRAVLLPLAGAVAAAVALFVITADESPPRPGHVLAVQGEARHGAEALRPGASIDLQEGLQTSQGARLELDVRGLGTVSMLAASALHLQGGAGASLGAGAARFEVRPQAEPFVVTAGPWSVRVIGTRFALRRHPDDEIRLELEEGIVEVSGRGRRVRLEAPATFESRAPVAVAPPPLGPDLFVGPPAPVTPPVAPKPRPRPRRIAVVAPPPAPPPAVEVQPAPAPEPVVEAAPAPSPEDLIAAARAETDLARAVAQLDAVAEGHAPFAEVALHLAAQRFLERGRWSAAESRYRYLLERFPEGELAREAKVSLLETLLRQGRHERARPLAESLVAGPLPARLAAEISFYVADARRRSGRCADALGLLASAGEHPDWAEPSLYYRAWCQLQLGDEAGARVSLETYLAKYPGGRFSELVRRRLGK